MVNEREMKKMEASVLPQTAGKRPRRDCWERNLNFTIEQVSKPLPFLWKVFFFLHHHWERQKDRKKYQCNKEVFIGNFFMILFESMPVDLTR